MENHSYNQIIGSTAAPYVNQIAGQCGLATNYTAVSHPSLPNYIAATSGSTQGITDDNPPSSHPLSVNSIFGQVSSASFQESMPSNCALTDSYPYAVKHNPEAYYTAVRTACGTNDVPLSQLSPNSLPAFSFVTPNLCNDTHDCSIQTGDAWLQNFIPTLTASSDYQAGKTAVFLTWDENDGTGGNQVATVVLSPYTVPGTRDSTAFNHYSLLRTTEELLGQTYLGGAATAASMSSAFHLKGSAPPPPPPPPPPSTCNVVASPGSGTAQTAINAAAAGQTVCLHGGIYTGTSVNASVIQPSHGGITVTSYPGETATLQNLGNTLYQPLYVPFGVNDITFSNLHFRGPYGLGQTIKIAGSRINLTNVDATNDNMGAQCLLLGGSEGRADNVHITNSVFHGCGQLNNNELECTYFANTLSVVFFNNTVYDCGSYAIQIYPNSGSGLYEHNTTDGGLNTIRGGLVLGGYSTTSNNEIRFNIFTGVKNLPIVHACFTDNGCTPSTAASAVSGNTVHDNCLWPFGAVPDFDSPIIGFTATNNLHADPLFIDRAAHNYALQAGSPCAGKGAG